MTISARRAALHEPPEDKAAHPGLIFSRYLKFAIDGQPDGQQAKENLLRQAAGAAAYVAPVYTAAYTRWKSCLPGTAKLLNLETAGRLVIGLGGENVTETGLTLHHSYGIPYLPGTALKGLASHYAHAVWGQQNRDWQVGGVTHAELFGTTEQAGVLLFFDGWLDPASLRECLVQEVLTPHHSDYGMAADDQLVGPSDFDSPIPVPFLAVQGKFLVAVGTWVDELPAQWVETALKLLEEALAEWGIGGKTSSGYGRLLRPEKLRLVGGGQSAGPGQPAVALESGKMYDTVLLAEKTKKGGWRAQIVGTKLVGAVTNSAAMPADLQAGAKLRLKLRSNDPKFLMFDYVVDPPAKTGGPKK